MGEQEKNIPPRIYHANDPDGIFELWKALMDEVVTDERDQLRLYQEIFDPDTTPEQYLDLMLANLGNPFSGVFLTVTQKRKLVKLLIPIFRQKGLAKGVINALRFMTGLEVVIVDPFANPDDGWQVGLGEVGESTFVGGEPEYANMLNYSEDFSESDWTLSNASISGAASGPSPWGRPATVVDFSHASAEISQVATPHDTAEEPFSFSIWARAQSGSDTIKMRIELDNDSADGTEENKTVTTAWQRFSVSHDTDPASSGDIKVILTSNGGFTPVLELFGAQLVRSSDRNPYRLTEDDGEDVSHPGYWSYHFFVLSPIELSANQIEVFELIIDYIKPAHTHYEILEPGDEFFIDHWEVGISRVGENNFIH